ncbi:MULTISPECIES: ornithine cyclodeaminase [Achromobacter]|uniref:Ornithine cyclodeaminase n=1 Tax=Achromobacter aegrifaciens TaxID=1287736 RepID=A0ABU2DEG1_ACHAE|nr:MULTISPECIES: ornithine cyclodeaminase [Achromobacter]MBD9382993.1 ornithine cyclodeaminase [Achromobacter sp. ACM02]MBD9471578.1 ornithine cyclodeaminase [Achromobacter sp. ACM01]MDR7946510.1 ornithine cyclodeaminase [Achromobacter aegrifaciens]RSF07453.1 ornithine cyclodeaminase [Achromobacter aegrifaciens]CAB3624905.1 Ornithine cyclodeaminase [Achromobacter aegrifaciens]
MTTLLSTSDVAKIVALQGPQQVFSGLLDYLLSDFLRWQEFDKSARVASHSATGVIELMPTADSEYYTFKYVNGHPGNPQAGLSTVMAFGALAQVSTGEPLLISELTLTTALRTAVTSALAARALARPDSRRMALIGNGAQSEFQALAFHYILGVDTLHVYDVDAGATRKLESNLASVPGLRVVRFDSAAEAVKGTDIVTTVTADKAYATILTADMVEPGMHINAVGGDCPGKTELHADVLRAGPVFVEYEPQTRIEGDLQQMPADFAVTELWRVLTGQSAGRKNAADVTIFDSVGFALEDFSALRWLRDAAVRHGVGARIEVAPQLPDPKNLFEAVRAAQPVAARA